MSAECFLLSSGKHLYIPMCNAYFFTFLNIGDKNANEFDKTYRKHLKGHTDQL